MSRSTPGSAFSWIISEQLVCCTNRVSTPSRMPAPRTQPLTSRVIS